MVEWDMIEWGGWWPGQPAVCRDGWAGGWGMGGWLEGWPVGPGDRVAGYRSASQTEQSPGWFDNQPDTACPVVLLVGFGAGGAPVGLPTASRVAGESTGESDGQRVAKPGAVLLARSCRPYAPPSSPHHPAC